MITYRKFVKPDGTISSEDVDLNAIVPPEYLQSIMVDHGIAGIIPAYAWIEVQKISPFGKWLTLLLYPFIDIKEVVVLRVVSATSNVMDVCAIISEVKPLIISVFSGAIEEADKNVRAVLSIQ